jgi:diguanylate cyclase (GGDEF)-like protein
VSPALARAPRDGVAARRSDAPRAVLTTYTFIGALLAGYFVSLVVRQPGRSGTWIDAWGVVAVEIVVSGLCLGRALTSHRNRAVSLALGLGILSWSIGDALLTAESAGGASPPTPSVADLFYLAFYPAMYVALVLLMRAHVRKLVPATWLDGAVAGLGAAAVTACFAFNTVLHSVGGDAAAAAVATNLAYPTGDALLLLLVVGGTAIITGRRNPQWLFLAGGFAINSVGDTFNLFQTGGATSQLATVLNGIAWPASILLISLSVWLRPNRVSPLAAEKTAGFLLPGLGATAGLAVLFVGTLHSVTPVALGLATATLLTVGVRLGVSVRRLRSLTEKRHRQAITDELTGLGNRRQLFYLLDAFFASNGERNGHAYPLSLLFVDLDHFKEINDSFGHAAGDELLRQLGPRMTRSLRDTDVLVRIGGDELAVVILDNDAAYAETVAQRLITELEQPFELDSVSVRIGASIGIASAPTDASDSAGLLRCADLAMYRAKLGSSSFETYRHEIDDGGNRLRLVEELRLAVASGRFELNYQPQVDLFTGMVVGVEALLRWPHPRVGLVPPLEFLPLAEEAGLMPALTAIVLDQALGQCAAWHAAGQPLTMSINISITNLLDPGFTDCVTGTLDRHHLPASSLMLELTETTVIRDFDRCKLLIANLRDLGLGVSIDDFGAGFTSLASLGRLAVNELKLDRSFITDLAANGQDRDLALVRATIELGHALEMRVVAEGVEDHATFALLASMGCDLAQGFFISRPMPARDLVLPTPHYRLLPEAVIAASA